MPVNVQSFHCTYNMVAYIHGAVPLTFPLPLLATLCLPFVSPSTYLAPSSCDRNRPPRSQVACKLTPFAPPFTQPTPPLQIPESQLPSALQRRPREYSGSCYPEQCSPLQECTLSYRPYIHTSILFLIGGICMPWFVSECGLFLLKNTRLFVCNQMIMISSSL
jgi:hypothetical protein